MIKYLAWAIFCLMASHLCGQDNLINNNKNERELRRKREVNYLESMYQADLSAASFGSDNYLVFPDSEIWAKKKSLRAKYKNGRFDVTDNISIYSIGDLVAPLNGKIRR